MKLFPAVIIATAIGFARRADGQIVEWTAMGDSYASGVGAGPQPPDDTNRCLRFPDAYPVVVQAELKPVPSKFNNVACSGNTFKQIRDKELLDKPEDDGKYGSRPAWGEAPEFVTITMGGNDIGILDLISTCIYSFKVWGMDCLQVSVVPFDNRMNQI
jgi:lysophospholipase L1-like esterase